MWRSVPCGIGAMTLRNAGADAAAGLQRDEWPKAAGRRKWLMRPRPKLP